MAAPHCAPLTAWTAALVLACLAAVCPAHAAPPAAKAPRGTEAACAASASPSTQYVSPASSRMRDQPRMEATVVATLPIATALQVECVANGWAQARSEGDRPAFGWIRTDMLQAQRPELEALIAAHAKAKPADRRALAERAVALAPFDARSHQLLVDTLTARKDRKGAQQAAAIRDRMVNPQGEQLPKEPWTLFAVEGGRASAVAIVDFAAGSDDASTPKHLQFRDASTWTPPGTKEGLSPFLLPWRGLHFYRRGGVDGVVQVLEAPRGDAIEQSAPVRHPPATAREDALLGLASNRAVTQAAAPSLAAPGRSERGLMDRFLREALKRERIPARAISALLAAGPDDENGGVQRYALAASGKPILLVTASWLLPARSEEAETPVLDAVLILEADGRGTYRVSHRLVQTTSGEGLSQHGFIDQLDLEQDGVPELFFNVGQYEGHAYEIWRCEDKAWKVVFKGAYEGV